MRFSTFLAEQHCPTLSIGVQVRSNPTLQFLFLVALSKLTKTQQRGTGHRKNAFRIVPLMRISNFILQFYKDAIKLNVPFGSSMQ